jgi:hypothetical protein
VLGVFGFVFYYVYRYRQSIVFHVPRDNELQMNVGEGGGNDDGNSNSDSDGDTDNGDLSDGRRADAINTLSVSPKNKRLVCVTGSSRLYWSSTEGKSGMMNVSIVSDMGWRVVVFSVGMKELNTDNMRLPGGGVFQGYIIILDHITIIMC